MHLSKNLQFHGLSIFAILSPFLSKNQRKFAQGHNAQCFLLAIIEKLKSSINKEQPFSAFLTELSKTFDWLPHKLLLAKLYAYGLSMATLRVLSNYQRKVK